MVTTEVEDMTHRITSRLRLLVEAESPSTDPVAVAAAFDVLRPMVTEASGREATIAETGGTPYLHVPAAAQPSVLLLGHVDTVWPVGTLNRFPFSLRDGRVRGPGAFDMKAGLLIGLEAWRHSRVRDHLALLVTGDEEIGSPISRPLIETIARDCVAVLVLEGAAPGGGLKAARKGVALYRFDVVGRASHAGLEPETGVNATVELAHLVLDLLALSDATAGTSVVPTVAASGRTTNTVPDHATLNLDVRAWTLAELRRVDAAVRRRRPTVEQATVSVEGGINRPPMEIHHSADLLGLARRAARDHDVGPVAGTAVGGASDGNFTAALGIPTLDGLGAVGGGAHALEEWVDVASLASRARLIARLTELVVDAC